MTTTPEIHGYYALSNTCSYGIHLSNDGKQAKIITNDKNSTDWLDVVWCVIDNEDDEGWEPIIDPDGYNIPLDQVIRAN